MKNEMKMAKINRARVKREALLPPDEIYEYVKKVKTDFIDQLENYKGIKQDKFVDPEEGAFRSNLLQKKALIDPFFIDNENYDAQIGENKKVWLGRKNEIADQELQRDYRVAFNQDRLLKTPQFSTDIEFRLKLKLQKFK